MAVRSLCHSLFYNGQLSIRWVPLVRKLKSHQIETKNTFSTPGELLETFSFKILFDMIFQLLLGQSGTFGFTMTNFVLGEQLVKISEMKAN